MRQIISVIVIVVLLLSLLACGAKETATSWQEQYDLGVRYLSEGNYSEAIIAFTAAIEINPKEATAYLGLADAYEALGDIEQAKKVLTDALSVVEDALVIQERLDKLLSREKENTSEDSKEAAYGRILDMFYAGIASSWTTLDGQGWEDTNDPDSVSYLFYHYTMYSLNEVGYALIDLNGDGQSELLVAPFDEAESGMFYELYTLSDGEIIHLISAGERDRYYLAVDYSINKEGSGGALNSSTDNLRLDADKKKLKVNKALIYDGDRDSEHPWFFATSDYYDESSYGINYDVLTNVPEDKVSEILNSFPENAHLFLQSFSDYDFSVSDQDNGTQAGASQSVTTDVVFDSKYDQANSGGMEYAVISGVDAQGNVLWSYTTERYEATELSRVESIGKRGELYYFNDSGTITTLNIQTGDIVWSNPDFGGANISFAFDIDDNLYVCGYYGPDFCAIGQNGETLRRIEQFDNAYFWPVGITIEESQAVVSFDEGSDGYGMGYKFYVNLLDWSFGLLG